ncbi:ribonuclease domain-containing protein [Corynebacterium suedekumii]|nr:ribonuclease domain-containing protein [Corynebacterium suedekumii]
MVAVIGGIALVAVAGWLGVDLSGDGADGGSDASGSPTQASGAAGTAADGDYETCSVDTLPREAEPVVEDILAGGPYEYPGEDGGHFGNYEGILPDERNSYYRSYTVDTPGLNHRGERRIVVGGGTETDPDVWFYSDDHYESFCLIPDAEGM